MTIRELNKAFLEKYCSNKVIQIDFYTPIEYEEQVYYVPDHDFDFTVDDDILREMLVATYKI